MNSCKNILILGVMLLAGSSLPAQNTFADVELSPKRVYIQQPFRLTVTVYTTTWFSAPLEFTDLHIPNAFVLSFNRTTPGIFHIKGQQYAGIQFYYIVFPYKAGQFIISPLEITAHTPAEGSATPRKLLVTTPEQSFIVRDVPENLQKNGEWLVAKEVDIYQAWSRPMDQLKVGDVVKRTITIDAKGTLPQFIPDLAAREALDWAGNYPQEPQLRDLRDENDANGRSIQTITYLFEKEGDYTVPPLSLSWWNPYTNQLHSKSTEPLKVHVAANPDLGILATLRDSLSAGQPTQLQAESVHKPFLILGMLWYWFVGLLLLVLFLLYLLIKSARFVFRHIRKKQRRLREAKQRAIEDNNNPFIAATQKSWKIYTSIKNKKQ